MKIAVLGPVDERPGIQPLKRTFAFGGDLVREFERWGHDVHLVVVGDVSDGVKEGVTRQSDGLSVHLIPGRRIRTQCLTLYAREVAAMRKILSEIKPDVVLAHWTYEYARAAVTSGFPSVIVAHDSPWRVWRVMREPRMLFRALYATLLVFPKARNLVAVSPHIKDELKGLFKGRLEVIPNGIPPQPPTRYRPPAARPTILCVTEGSRLKNASVLLAAYERLRKTHPDWQLKVFMKGRNAVSRSEVLRILREEADVFCSPSLEESFGMAFLEAMACGVPCVGGERSGAVPWVLGDTGVVCDVTNAEKLAESIEHVLIDGALHRRLSQSARARAESCFGIDQVAVSYLSLLQSVAAH